MSESHEPLPSPYIRDTILELKVRGLNSKIVIPHLSGHETELRVRIIDVIEPSTMSVVLHVKLELEDHTTPVPTMVLKVFDRHFSAQLREFLDSGPATKSSELQFINFVREGYLPLFMAAWEQEGPCAYDEWNVSRREACFQYRSVLSHEIELEIYDRLVAMQGVHVPNFFADVRLRPQHEELQVEESLIEDIAMRAILMEYIDEFPLDEIVNRTPELDWAPICDQAIEVIRSISDSDFINFDIKPRNILVRRQEEKAYEVFYLDFGECRFRDPSDSSDEVWRERKRQRCEEGAVGYIMMNHISRAKGKKGKKYKGSLPLPWEYSPSNRFEGDYIELYGNAG
ncbi:hypothetical protein TI39_contig4119g00010 [Zymoseptoria brevis]|uniref:Protein kinase domain-containing protein n=1 Tax=Zymoseptoria brevis TaxID=1047168 RepID=A0A0F4GGH8_9PEZI|nr:hypothetical protein TI39_contig4119g00010 [Zymoseptoria brevis]